MEATVLGSAASPGVAFLRATPPAAGPSTASSSTLAPLSPGAFLAQHAYADSQAHAYQSPARTSPAPRVIVDGPDELAWTPAGVTWSRGAQLHRRFTFDAGEAVACAAFVLFPLGPGLGSSAGTGAQPPVGTGHGSGKAAASQDVLKGETQTGEKRSRTFGPFHKGQHAVWGAAVPSRSSRATSASSSNPAPLVRALVVFLQTRAHIFLPSGETIVRHVPFVADAVFPLETGGALVQRALAPRERRRLERGGAAAARVGRTSLLRHLDALDRTALSAIDELDDLGVDGVDGVADRAGSDERLRLFSLDRTYGELRPVAAVGPDETPTDATEAVKPDCAVLHAQNGVAVVYDRSAHTLHFCTLVHSPQQVEPAVTARTMRPGDMRADAKRARSSLARAEADRRVSAAAMDLGDHATRRTARRSKLPEDELFTEPERGRRAPAAARASLALAAEGSRRASAGPSFLFEDEVAQFMREDEGGVSLAARGPGAALGFEEKELRETTMMMGLDGGEAARRRSDWVLRRVWSWTPHKPVDENTSVFVTEEREPTACCLNVHLADTLYIFRVHRSAHTTTFSEHRAMPCTAAVPVVATRHGMHDTLVLADGALRLLVVDRAILVSVPEGKGDVARRLEHTLSMAVDARAPGRVHVGLEDARGSTAVVVYDDGERVRVDIDCRPKGLVRQCVEALACVLPAHTWADFADDLAGSPTWADFAAAVRRAAGLPHRAGDARARLCASALDPIARRLAALSQQRHAPPAPPTTGQPTALAAPALLALHLVAQDCRLSSTRRRALPRLAPLLVELAAALGRRDWHDYWLRLVPGLSVAPGPPCPAPAIDAFDGPPDILAYLSRRLLTPTRPFPAPHDDAVQSEHGQATPCAQTDLVCGLYDAFAVGTAADVVARAHRAVHFIVAHGKGKEWLADLPAGIAVPVYEMLRVAQASPGAGWAREVYELVGREDLAARCLGDQAVAWDTKQEIKETNPTIRDLVAGTRARYQPGAFVRFGQDRRVQEVERIMQTNTSRTVAVQDPPGANEQTVLQYHQNVVNTIANRTLAITVGQGIFEYGTRTATITDPWPIPLIELAVKTSPGNAVVKAQLAADGAEWPCFHNGVSRALAVSPDATGIDSAWIVFNRPATLNPEHGGFLLGLGLTGHLRPLTSYHAFAYLEPRHETTSVGLLLGLAASFAGSRDVLVTKMLSLHTHALLPHGSMDLQAQPTVQAVALLGVGLVYAGSRDLRTAEVALGEIGRTALDGVDGFAQHAEAYSFAASTALGLVMLGRGGGSEADKRIADLLVRRVYGGGDGAVDITVTAPGAALALGLMYLRTNRADVAASLAIPQNAVALDSVRPDLLLVLTFARALILWDAVKPSQAWFDAQFPAFIRRAVEGQKRAAMDLTTELAYFNIVAGACLAVGIKYAGTASEAAHNCLIAFFTVLGKAAAGQSMTYEGRIRRHGARQALNVVTIALAATMSGTGELNVLRRLRVSHGQEGAGVTYGSHMAMHMALGLLYLGRGYHTLGDSDLAVAAMAIAFFPRFAAASADNRAYPQALRHLWALASEPRCLVARDVETRETVYLPVRVRTSRAGRDEHGLISPTLVPPFDTLHALAVDSPRYWPVRYDLAEGAGGGDGGGAGGADRAQLVGTRTVWVKRRAAYADYNVDPRGHRSVFVRAGAMTGLDMHHDLVGAAAPPAALAPGEIAALVRAHTADPAARALVAACTGESPLERLVRTVALECLSHDKPALVGTYLELYLGLLADARAGAAADGLAGDRRANVGMLRRFLAAPGYAAPAGADKRFPLIRASLVGALDGAPPPAHAEARAYLSTGQWPADPAAADALARALAARAVPAVPLLDALAGRVRAAHGQSPGQLALRVRDAAHAYQAANEAQWDAEGGRAGGGPAEVAKGRAGLEAQWGGDDVREAVDVWLGA